MLEWAKAFHEAVGIESPKVFIGVFAVFGFLLFGGVAWLIDKGYRVKLKEQAVQAAALLQPSAHLPAPPTETPKPRTRRAKRIQPPSISPPSQDSPVVRDIRIVSQDRVPSDDPAFPYGLRVTIQTTVTIQPVSIEFKCDGEVGKGQVWFGGDQGEIFTKERSGVLLEDRDTFLASFESPAFPPDKAMLVTLFSKSPIRVLSFTQVPFQF